MKRKSGTGTKVPYIRRSSADKDKEQKRDNRSSKTACRQHRQPTSGQRLPPQHSHNLWPDSTVYKMLQ